MSKPLLNAFQFPEVRVVEASAGSGKTYALAKRYIQLLLNPSSPQAVTPMRNILAITFTNKAAFEMKARILDFLKKIALGKLAPLEAEHLLSPLGITATAARDQAFNLMEELIRHYNFFAVQTIDSFINALLSGSAFKIGLSANFRIKRNALEYLIYSLDELIDRASSDEATRQLFERFLYQYLFLENKPGWFPKKDMQLLLMALYQQSQIYGGHFVPFTVENMEKGINKIDMSEVLFTQKQLVLKNMRQLVEVAGEALDGRFKKSLDEFLNRYSQGFDIDRVSDFFAREVLPVKKGTDLSASTDKFWDKIREQLRQLCEVEAYAIFNPYIDVFFHVLAGLKEKSARDDVLFLEQLNQKARALFDESAVTVEELYFRLATRFRHYLIDEFQDTSLLQWQNLLLMVEEALSSGGSLFYVGDKKQAIYGFRGGEVQLFDRLQEDFKNYNVQHERLANNYRSHRAVVEFNNMIFSPENISRFIDAKSESDAERKKKDEVYLNEEDVRRIENVFEAARQTYSPGHEQGYVKVEHICADKKEERDELTRVRLLDLIRSLSERFDRKDIAILTRSNSEIAQITSWLMAQDITVESERTLNIKENPVVMALVDLLTFLQSPIDNLAFARFILGELFSRASGEQSSHWQEFVFSSRGRIAGEKDFYLYTEFRRQYPELWQKLFDEYFRNAGLYPLYETLTSILEAFRVLPNFPDDQGFVMRFLELIRDQEEDHRETSDFLEYFAALENEELYVNAADSDSIKILTVHKAKGLEFKVVIIPSLQMKVQVTSGGDMGQLSYIMDREAEELRLLRIKEKYLKFSPRLADLWHARYVESFISELNTVYVATTRAVAELYLFVPNKAGSGHNLASQLIPEEQLQWGAKTEYPRSSEEQQRRVRLELSEYRDWLNFLREEFQGSEAVIDRAGVQKGTQRHFLLSFISNLAGQDQEKQIACALAQFRLVFPDGKDDAISESFLRQVLAKKELQPFFNVPGAEIFQEKEIVTSLGHTKRIDRLIVKKDEVWVVDYKSSREGQEVQQSQVREYLAVLKEIYPSKVGKGFLLYLDDLEVSEVL